MAKKLPPEEKLRRQEKRKAVAKAKRAANNRLYRIRVKNRPCPHCVEKDKVIDEQNKTIEKLRAMVKAHWKNEKRLFEEKHKTTKTWSRDQVLDTIKTT